jgi:putative hydrolase of the HAD superfamily
MDNWYIDMKSPVTTVLFDMDNTLFDLVGAQIAACNAVAGFIGQTDGRSLFEDYFMSDHHGFESHENIRDYLCDHTLPDGSVYREACHIYETVKLDNIVPYDGVCSTLEELQVRDIPMAIITDAHSRDATKRLEKSGLFGYFDGMVAFDMVRVKKPSHEPFLFALEMMQAGPDTTLLVGDSPHRDIRPARDLGMQTVYAKYGDRFSSLRECPDADFCINRMDELLQIL